MADTSKLADLLLPKPTNSNSSAPLKLSGIEQLKPPGPDSNYLNWKFVVMIHLRLAKVLSVLTPFDAHL
jgi:hypothetical protein